ncbi:hypothetical protein VEE28_40180 [Escherichia coli]|nr:hypothetical protein VEE28_40180 [Escherichia coli]
MLPSETMIWQPEFTDKTLSRKPGAVQSYMLSLSEQTKLNAFLSGILDDYKTGVITQIQAVGKIGALLQIVGGDKLIIPFC